MAHNVIKELHELIVVKLMRQRNGPGRARYRAWMRYKRDIVFLLDKLKDVREAILGAICTDIRSVISSSIWS